MALAPARPVHAQATAATNGATAPGADLSVCAIRPNARNGGNPDLKPEKADTTTAGIVFQPHSSITLTADYWSLKENGVIGIEGAQNQILYDYLLRWMARAVQQPALPGEVAVVLRGGRGVGKGMFVKEFGYLFDVTGVEPFDYKVS